jgi:hypothetical protein
MLYGHAHTFTQVSKSYTMLHAHQQVQAIRLMKFEATNGFELEDLILNHRTFDTAYAYLQRLTQQRLCETTSV